MMDAITDQGEGSVLKRDPTLLAAVKPSYVSDKDALESDYPSFDDKGQLAALGRRRRPLRQRP